VLTTGLRNWLKGVLGLFLCSNTTSLFNRKWRWSFNGSLCLSGFHRGGTYSGTFHTDGGGLGGFASPRSGLAEAFSRYKASPAEITFNGVTTESFTITGVTLDLRLFDTLVFVAVIQPFWATCFFPLP
jgi:hypothetical protein